MFIRNTFPVGLLGCICLLSACDDRASTINVERAEAPASVSLHENESIAQAGYAHLNVSDLLATFTEAMAEDFEVVGHWTAEVDNPASRVPNPWWVVEVRPRRPGAYVVRHEYTMSPDSRRPFDPEVGGREYWIAIGERRKKRVFHGAWSPYRPHPTACLGDTLILPFLIPDGWSDHRFVKISARPDYAESMFQLWAKEAAEIADRMADKQQRGVETINLADAHLDLLQVEVHSRAARPPGVMTHSIAGVFVATEPGRLNLLFGPEGPEPAGRGLPIVICADEQPLRVPVFHTPVVIPDTYHLERSHFSRRGSWPPVVLRVGDMLSVRLWEYRSTYDEWDLRLDIEHPTVTIRPRPFDGSWPLRIMPVDQE